MDSGTVIRFILTNFAKQKPHTGNVTQSLMPLACNGQYKVNNNKSIRL